ncbi:hypothetical protein FGO68_gene6859 [Halteria grandinella]|uniref:Uncharacterized protein n=1 Tax=Halteria grandinella TaxID=5974 RepID=A0A8J8NB95_HALGN|nr:hypothetical protein FGO68_gene6859 [Halteria grandinella]
MFICIKIKIILVSYNIKMLLEIYQVQKSNFLLKTLTIFTHSQIRIQPDKQYLLSAVNQLWTEDNQLILFKQMQFVINPYQFQGKHHQMDPLKFSLKRKPISKITFNAKRHFQETLSQFLMMLHLKMANILIVMIFKQNQRMFYQTLMDNLLIHQICHSQIYQLIQFQRLLVQQQKNNHLKPMQKENGL